MTHLKYYLLLISIFLFVSLVRAQSISGVVLDSLTRKPLAGASVFVENTFRGTVTDRSGKYNIPNVGRGHFRVTATYMGYKQLSDSITIRGKQAAYIQFRLAPVSYEQQAVNVVADRQSKARSNLPLTAIVLGEVALQQTSETNIMPVLSMKIPGLFVTQRGAGGFGIAEGAAGKLSIRGIGSAEQSQLLIAIDGQPQVMGIFGHSFPDMFNTSDYRSVEVVRGPASVLYGSNAMGGVVNLVTHDPDSAGTHGSLTAHYGSFGTLRVSPRLSYRSGKLAMAASYTHDRTDGHRPNSRYRSNHGHFKAGWNFNKNLDLSLSAGLADLFSVDPGPTSNPDEYANGKHWADVLRGNAQISFKNNYERLSGHANLFFNQGNHDIYTNWQSMDRNYGVSVYESFSFIQNNLFGVGFDWNRYGGQGNTVEPFDNWIDVTETGGFAFVQHTFWEALTLNAAGRVHNHSVYGNRFVPQVGAVYALSESQSVKALASNGFRSPNVKELYFFPTSNDTLTPESMWNYELGYTQYLLDRTFKTSFTAFFIDGENAIQLVRNTQPMPPFKFQNSGTFQHWGFEWEATYRPRPNLLVEASYAYLHTDVPRLGAPAHQLYLGANYTLNRFDFSLNAQGIAGLYTSVAADNPTREHYVMLNARANIRAGRALSVFVSGNNLLNWDYEINNGYPMPGLSVLGGLVVRWN